MIHFGAVERHLAERDGARLCDGEPASDADISSEDWMEIREARVSATLCPECQDKLHPLDVQPELYGMGRHSSAHLYAVPVLAAFDAIRNCSHCRRRIDDNCPAWRKARKAVAVLQEQSVRFVRGVDELHHATGGCTATVYEFVCGSVAYFAPEAPDFAEAGELKGADLARTRRILDERGMPGGMAAELKDAESIRTASMAVGMPGSVAAS